LPEFSASKIAFEFDNSEPGETPRNLQKVNRLGSMEWTPRVCSREDLALAHESSLEIN
jgi:hypothetical protein